MNTAPPASAPSSLDELAERVERLVLRYQEQVRVNQLLEQQLQQLRSERDSLKARLGAARGRIDALLERLPADPPEPAAAAPSPTLNLRMPDAP